MMAQHDNSQTLAAVLERGKALEQARQHGQAMAQYQEWLATQPGTAPLHLGIARCARALGQHETALTHFEAAHALEPGDRQKRLDLAQALLTLGRTGTAQSHYQALAASAPNNAAAHTGLGRCARKSGAHAEALTHFQAAARLQPDDARHLFDIAETLRSLARLEEAAATFRQTLERVPNHAGAHSGLAYVLRSQGKRREAGQHFALAAKLLPNNTDLPLEAATEQREARQFDQARATARGVREAFPHYLPALHNLAETERAAGRHEVALEILEEGLARSPRDAQLLLKAAHCLRVLQRLDEAKTMYRRVITEQPGNGWAYVGLGQSAKRQGQLQEAEECFAQALAVAPADTALRLDLASEQRDMGHFDEARSAAHSILTSHPAHFRALTSLAETERTAGQYEAALQWLHKAHAQRPHDVEILVKMATAARQLSRQEECNHYLETALQIDPLAVAALRGLAEQYMRADDAEAARDLLQTAILEKPDDITLQFTLLDALIASGMPEAALALMDEVEAKTGAHPTILTKRAHTLRRIGLYHEAMAAARQATTLYPYNNTAWLERFHAEVLLNADPDIEALLSNLPAVTPQETAQAERCHGAFAERQWRFGDAAAYYTTAMARHANNAGIAFNLARVHLLTLELAQAKTLLQHHRDLDAPNLRLRGKSLNTSQTLYGQLLDEYALNETPPRVHPLLNLPAPARLEALLPLVKAEPDNTAAAVALVMALRHGGGLSTITHPGAPPITKMIFQFWDSTDIPEDIARYRATWRAQNQDYAVHSFDNASALAFLQKAFPPAVAQAYQHAIEPAQKADIFRLAILFAYGGVYADADDRCQRPLQTLLPASASLVLYQEDLGTIGNNFIATSPRHPLILKALQLSIQAINRGDADITWLSTGPGMITRAFAQSYASGEQGLPGQTLVLSIQQLCPVIAIHCHCAYKKTKKHWSNSSFSRKRDTLRPQKITATT